MELRKKFELFSHGPKKDFSEEKLVAEIEKEGGQPQILPPPMVQRPAGAMPMPSIQRPQAGPARPALPAMLTEQQVVKLPLFMKVEEYDRIVSELNTLADSLKKMEEILSSLTDLEEKESRETDRWRGQLEITKTQLRQLLAHMPETGKMKELVELRKKQVQSEKIKKEMTGLQKDLKKVSAVPQKRPAEQLSSELQNLRANIGGIQEDMRSLHEEIKRMSEEAAARKKAEETQKKSTGPYNFPKPEYRKVEGERPW